MPPYTRQHLGELLLEEGKIRETDLQRALDTRGSSLLGDVLISHKACTEDDVLDALSRQLGIWRVRLSELDINPTIIAKVKAKVAAHYEIVPLYFRGNALVVASANPQDSKRFDELKVLLGCPVKPMLCGREEIDIALTKYYGLGNVTPELPRESEPPPPPLTLQPRHPAQRLTEEEESVADVVDEILLEASQSGATDIHIEPSESGFNIRTRVYGILAPAKAPLSIDRFGSGLVARIKDTADLDIAEHSIPQSGRARVRVGDEYLDMRISVLPSVFGESVHIKLLSANARFFDLIRLGMTDRDLIAVERAIGMPDGMILVTGPSASGKTTSLYAMLKRVRSDSIKAITIEHPVEYRLEGVTQLEATESMSFADGVREALAHDPDVLLLGNLSDTTAADAALRASLTGRKVLAGMYADNGAEALARLVALGAQAYLIATGVRCVVAQRLVRTLCENCKTKVRQESDLFAGQWTRDLKMPKKVYENAGCSDCGHTGFKGQTAIFEVLTINDDVREAISRGASAREVQDAACGAGMRTLLEDGLAKVADGRTTMSEILRVLPAIS